jgi:hypothetical protein
VGEDRRARPAVRGGRGLEDAPVAIGGSAVAAGDLDDARPMLGPADDRARIIVRVDAGRDVGREEVGELVHGDAMAPVRRAVVAIVVQAGRGDDVHARPAAQIGEHGGVAAGVAGHRVDGGRQPQVRSRRHLRGHRVDVGEVELGLHLDRPAAVDDEVLVGIGDAHVRRVDVAEDRPNERHDGAAATVAGVAPAMSSTAPSLRSRSRSSAGSTSRGEIPAPTASPAAVPAA